VPSKRVGWVKSRVKNFRDLKIWQFGKEIVVGIYKVSLLQNSKNTGISV
jgi:hypothetical protein